MEDKLTGAVIGLAMKVHRGLGHGFLESVYRRALCHEIRKADLPFDDEERLKVFYDQVVVGEFVADIIVDHRLILELKAASALSKADEQQLVNYLKATGIDVGLLLNFGTPSLEFKRKVRHLPSSSSRNPENPV